MCYQSRPTPVKLGNSYRFLDDVLGESVGAHLDHLRQERFRKYDLKFKPRKCEFFRQNVVEMGVQYIETGRYCSTQKHSRDPGL